MKLKDLINLPKGNAKQSIFFLLLTAALVYYFLINTKAEYRYTVQTKSNIQRCSFKYLSPENLGEGSRLLNNITWPETAPLPNPFSLNLTTSSAKSSFTIVPRAGGRQVGDELTVSIQLRDYNGNPKKGGGDFIISRLHNKELGAGVVGQVQDHLNGTFTVRFPLLWNGTANVEVMLVHPSESITVLKRLMEEEPGRVFSNSDFRSGRVTEKSICNVCLNPDRAPVCNFTDLNTGEQWFCYKPKTLDCNTRVSHVRGLFIPNISKEEKTLFQTGINMKVYIVALGESTVTILPKAGETTKMRPVPSGYYYRNQWRPLRDFIVRPFNNASAYTDCLKGKQLHMFGDSTTRQFYMHITRTVPNLVTFDKHTSFQCGPFLAIDRTNDIIVTQRCHAPPIHSYAIPVSQLKYVASELDRLAGGPDTVVVIGVWAHFAPYPREVYYQRLMTIVKAIQRLQNRAPGTKVIVRTANLRAVNLNDALTFSDWYAWQLDKVLRAVFKNMDVFLLDVWDMVQAHYLPHNVHPAPPILKLMVDRILSYTCPTKGN